MALIDDIKLSLRLSTDAMDSEVQMLVDSALYDMERVGVDPDLLLVDGDDNLANAFVKNAVTCYCKAHFGYDNGEADRFDESYRRIVCDLLNSSRNIAAIGEVAYGEEETGNVDAGLGSVQEEGRESSEHGVG